MTYEGMLYNPTVWHIFWPILQYWLKDKKDSIVANEKIECINSFRYNSNTANSSTWNRAYRLISLLKWNMTQHVYVSIHTQWYWFQNKLVF